MTRRPVHLCALALATAFAAVIVWIVARGTARGEQWDDSVLTSLATAAAPALETRIDGIAELAGPVPFVLATIALLLAALARGRPLMAVAVGGILLSASVTTAILKPVLGADRVVAVLGSPLGPTLHYEGSWPSGHSTAAMSLALCAMLVAGPRLRPLAATLGAAYAVGVGYALVALGWHLPSDVLGGYLVATAFTLGGVGALAAAEARWAPRTARRAATLSARERLLGAIAPVGAAIGGLAAVSLAAAAALSRAPDPSRLIDEHMHALAAGSGIALVAIVLTAAAALAMRRS